MINSLTPVPCDDHYDCIECSRYQAEILRQPLYAAAEELLEVGRAVLESRTKFGLGETALSKRLESAIRKAEGK